VPTNADLWVLLAGWSPTRVTLNGVPLSQLPLQFGYELGDLLPDTSYTVEVEVDPSYAEPSRLDLTFRTGTGPALADPGAAPGQVSTLGQRNVALTSACNAVLWTQDCFDTGQSMHYLFTPTGSAEAWLMVSDSDVPIIDVWPAECGSPQYFMHDGAQPCVTLHGIDAIGATHAGERACFPPIPPGGYPSPWGPGGEPIDAGCSFTIKPNTTAQWLAPALAALALGLGRLRRRGVRGEAGARRPR
jgi:hypothetical protein